VKLKVPTTPILEVVLYVGDKPGRNSYLFFKWSGQIIEISGHRE